jgi:hypothetical protein
MAVTLHLKALAAVAMLLALTYWTTMLTPPTPLSAMDREFHTHSNPPLKGEFYKNIPATIIMWLLVGAATYLYFST